MLNEEMESPSVGLLAYVVFFEVVCDHLVLSKQWPKSFECGPNRVFGCYDGSW